MKQYNRVDVDLLTDKKQEAPLYLDDETLDASASVLANMILDFVRAIGTERLTPRNVFKKEEIK